MGGTVNRAGWKQQKREWGPWVPLKPHWSPSLPSEDTLPKPPSLLWPLGESISPLPWEPQGLCVPPDPELQSTGGLGEWHSVPHPSP